MINRKEISYTPSESLLRDCGWDSLSELESFAEKHPDEIKYNGFNEGPPEKASFRIGESTFTLVPSWEDGGYIFEGRNAEEARRKIEEILSIGLEREAE
ncbi:hypothetical protein HY450_00980 [Candidatus Pacearchaeota archaeon]|nr:hypothetical protein [Candidatus Pacearchaeota archaeon]